VDDLYLTEARRLPEERRLRLTWSDGFSAEIDVDTLRGYCPCATCQGHGSSKVVFHPPKKAVSILQIEPVGNYAISFLFSDGHGTGIYRYDFLRRIADAREPG
jgi:DUF971 family protein